MAQPRARPRKLRVLGLPGPGASWDAGGRHLGPGQEQDNLSWGPANIAQRQGRLVPGRPANMSYYDHVINIFSGHFVLSREASANIVSQ